MAFNSSRSEAKLLADINGGDEKAHIEWAY